LSRYRKVQDFKIFAPNSAGSPKMLRRATVETINSLPNALRLLSLELDIGYLPTTVENFLNFSLRESRDIVKESLMASLLNSYGSDKANFHDYHKIYANLISPQKDSNPVRVLEIGIGTNSEGVLSNMGKNHVGVGGSLRAFRDFYETDCVVGLDIDPASHFREEGIRTFYVDQLAEQSFDEILSLTEREGKFDLIIDDGLHSIDANLNTLRLGLRMLAPGGWLCIEDIRPELDPFWTLLIPTLRDAGLESWLVRMQLGDVFVVRNSGSRFPKRT